MEPTPKEDTNNSKKKCCYIQWGGSCQQEATEEVDGYNYCRMHMLNFTRECSFCIERRHEQNISYFADGENHSVICCDCEQHEELNECGDCGYLIDTDLSIRRGYCSNCFNNNRENIIENSFRPVDINTNAHLDKSIGNIVKSNRIFSCEIESMFDEEEAIEPIAEGMPKSMGISSDGSLDGNGYGVEFQTPRLRGKKGEQFIIDLCNKLKENNFYVNTTCGMHIHLDAGRKLFTTSVRSHVEQPIKLKALILFYLYYDEVLLSMQPSSRHGNRFCYLLGNNYVASDIESCKTLQDFEAMWYKERRADKGYEKRLINQHKRGKYDGTRYSGVNFHSLLKDKHLEIRFHAGTINASKILYWIALNARIVDMIADGKITLSKMEEVIEKYNKIRENRSISIEEKTLDFLNLLNSPSELREYVYQRQEKFGIRTRNRDEDESSELVINTTN